MFIANVSHCKTVNHCVQEQGEHNRGDVCQISPPTVDGHFAADLLQ
jgi:hypothetical protein